MPMLVGVKLGLMVWGSEKIKLGRKVQHIRKKNEKEKEPITQCMRENWDGFPPRRLMLMEEEEMGVLVFVSSIWKSVSHASLKLCELFVINALTETVYEILRIPTKVS